MTTTTPAANPSRICPICKNSFTLSSGRGRPRTYCSEDCSWKAGLQAIKRFWDRVPDDPTKEAMQRAYKGLSLLFTRREFSKSLAVASLSALSAPLRPTNNGAFKEALGLRTKTEQYDYAWNSIQTFRQHLSKGPDPALKPSIRVAQTVVEEHIDSDLKARRLWWHCQRLLMDAGVAAPYRRAFGDLDQQATCNEEFWKKQRGEKLQLVKAIFSRATLGQWSFEDGLPLDLREVVRRLDVAENIIRGWCPRDDTGTRELLLHQKGILQVDCLLNLGQYDKAAKGIAFLRELGGHLDSTLKPRAGTITLRHEAICALGRKDFSRARDCLEEIKAKYGDPPPVGPTTRLMLLRINADVLWAENEKDRARDSMQKYAALWQRYPYSHYEKYLHHWEELQGERVVSTDHTEPQPTYASSHLPYLYLTEWFAEP